MPAVHQELAAGKWFELSLAEQLGNIGSEVHRAAMYEKQDQERSLRAMMRALELLDLTLEDERWKGRRKELTLIREAMGDALSGGSAYGSSYSNLDAYLYPFAFLARTK